MNILSSLIIQVLEREHIKENNNLYDKFYMILLLAITLSVSLGSVILETKEALAIMVVFQNKCLAKRVV